MGSSAADSKPLINVNNVSFSYGSIQVLKDVTFATASDLIVRGRVVKLTGAVGEAPPNWGTVGLSARIHTQMHEACVVHLLVHRSLVHILRVPSTILSRLGNQK